MQPMRSVAVEAVIAASKGQAAQPGRLRVLLTRVRRRIEEWVRGLR